MSETKKYFPNGLWFKTPHEKAPDFVKGQISIKVEDFKQYLNAVKGEYLNIDLKVSQEGKPYAEINTFVPDKSKAKAPAAAPPSAPPQQTSPSSSKNDDIDDLPF